jgi:ABC-type nickel/cobalt efflux system permease component RcnA
VFGLDQLIAGLGDGSSPALVAAVAVLLGLRHATDPDHLVAVSTLVATEGERPTGHATRLGAAWGAGHACTLIALGLPVVFFGAYLRAPVQRAAEILVGVVIVLVALRLLRRWRAGAFHVHEHEHDGVRHRHLHRHDQLPGHEHEHPQRLGRSPAQAFGVGLMHGIGGSAGIGLLLLASIGDRGTALGALLLFATAAMCSMALFSASFGYALGRPAIRHRFESLAPMLGLLSLAFGAWYAAAAVAALAGSL